MQTERYEIHCLLKVLHLVLRHLFWQFLFFQFSFFLLRNDLHHLAIIAIVQHPRIAPAYMDALFKLCYQYRSQYCKYFWLNILKCLFSYISNTLVLCKFAIGLSQVNYSQFQSIMSMNFELMGREKWKDNPQIVMNTVL